MPRIVACVLSCLMVAVGVGLIYVPAGVIVGGLLGIGGCYVWSYLAAKGSK